MPARELAVALLALAACGDNLPGPPATVEVVQVASISLTANPQLDLLVVMDDTIGLDAVQFELLNYVGEFLGRLASATGELPGLHLGLTTSDMGSTGSSAPDAPAPGIGSVGNGGCAGRGRDGALRISSNAADGSFLIDEPSAGGRITNYQGDLATAFSTMLNAGGGGCGFEQHLRAMERALINPVNAGFLRRDVGLAILVVADEDDCSVRNPRVFDPAAVELGPFQSFRCTTGGLKCNEPVAATGFKTGCEPDEDSPTIRGVQPVLEFLDALRPRQDLVIAGIIGDPSPVLVELRTPPGGGNALLTLGNVCGMQAISGGVNAGVRLASAIDHFEAHGTRSSICGGTLRGQFLEAARAFKQLLGVACIDATLLADASPDEDTQPNCEAYVVRDGERELVPMCPADGPCVELARDVSACPEGLDYLRATLRGADPGPGQLELYCERSLPPPH